MSRTTHPKDTKETIAALDPTDAKSFLESITKIAGPAPALTAKDRIRSVKLRKGGEKVVPTILALSDRIGLVVPSHPTSAIRASFDKAKALAAAHETVSSAEKHLADSTFVAQAVAWEGATVHYTMLRRLAKTDGDIANSLASVTAFFAKKPAAVSADDAKDGQPQGAAATTAPTPATAPSNGVTRS